MRTIPKISDERLAELCERIKPIMKTEEGFRRIEDVDPRKVAFTWDPKPVGDVLLLAELGTCTSYHNCGYYGFFKPSIAEVLVAIPEEQLEKVDFFWLDKASVQVTGEPLLHKPDEHNEDGYHRAVVTLFERT